MLDKIKSFWDVFKQGQAVADPTAWKKGQITTTMLGGLFIALVQLSKSFGYDIPLDADTSTAVAGGIIALVNWLLTVTTTDKIGLLPADKPIVPENTVSQQTIKPSETMQSKPENNFEGNDYRN